MNENKVLLTWDDVERATLKLADQIRNKADHIVCVSRDGLFIGGLLSQMLPSRLVSVIVSVRYTKIGISSLPFIDPIDLDLGLESVIVDAIVDKGVTMRAIRNLYRNTWTATAFCRSYSKGDVHFFGRELTDNEGWIEFPWDKYEDEVKKV